jgi:peroxiredoxin Q/BCP
VLAVSTDDAATLRRFRESLGSKDTFVSDEEGTLARLYDVKWPVLKVAGRVTFVIGEGRRILKVQDGNEAIHPEAAVAACPLRKKKAEAAPAPAAPDAGTR